MPTPGTPVSATIVALNSTGSSKASSSVSWQTGDIITVIGGAEGACTIGLATAPGLTFQVKSQFAGSGTAAASFVFTARATSNSSGAVTVANSNSSLNWGFVVYVDRGCSPGKTFEQHTTTKTVAFTPTAADSMIRWAAFDFSAGALGSLTPAPTNTQAAAVLSTRYTYYVGDLTDQTSAGSVSYGVGSTASTGVFSIIGIELVAGDVPNLIGVGATAAGTTTVVVAEPSGANASIADDVLLAFIIDHATTGTSVAPTGWTLIANAAATGGRIQVFRAIRGAGGLTGTSWTWPASGTNLTTRSQGVIAVYDGVSTTTPEDVAASARSNASGTTGTTGITTATNQARIVAAFGGLASGNTWTVEAVATSPTLTEIFDAANSTFCSIALADGTLATAGSTGNSSGTMSVAGANASALVALRPAGVSAAQFAVAISGSATVTAALTTQITPAVAVSASATAAAALTTSSRCAGAVASSATVTAALTTAITPAVALTVTATASAALTTAIACAGAISASATVSSTLVTPIYLSTSITGSATVVAALTTSIRAAGAISASSTVAAALSTSITCAGAVASSATVAAALTTSIRLASAISATATVAANLQAGSGLAGTLACSAAVTAALTTQITLASSLATSATSTAALTTVIRLQGSVAASGAVAGALTTSIRLAGSVSSTAAVTAALTTGITLQAAIAGTCAVAAPLSTAIRCAAAVSCTATLAADLVLTLSGTLSGGPIASYPALVGTILAEPVWPSARALAVAPLAGDMETIAALAAIPSAYTALSGSIEVD